MGPVIESVRRNYNTVDLLKFLMALCIVAIHTNVLQVIDIDNSQVGWMFSSMVIRLGVPLFFSFSGFFLGNKIFKAGRDQEKIRPILKNYCVNLTIPLAVWGLIGLIIKVIDYAVRGKKWYLICAYAVRTIFYPLNAMWFLWAAIIGSIIIVFIYCRFRRWKTILLIFSLLGYAFVLLCNNYYFLVDNTLVGRFVKIYMKCFVSARNGIFLAPLFLGAGFVLNDEKLLDFIKTHRVQIICAAVLSYLLLSGESFLLFKSLRIDDRGFFVSFIPLIPLLTAIALTYNITIPLPYTLLRRLSTSIYFMHRTIRSILEYTVFRTDPGLMLFVATVLISIVIALISYRFDNKTLRRVLG